MDTKGIEGSSDVAVDRREWLQRIRERARQRMAALTPEQRAARLADIKARHAARDPARRVVRLSRDPGSGDITLYRADGTETVLRRRRPDPVSPSAQH